MKLKIAVAIAAATGALAFSAAAYADTVEISINGTVESTGSGTTSTGVGDPGYNAGLGGILVDTAAGNFVVTSASVTGSPPLPAPTLDSNTFDVTILTNCGGLGCRTGGTLTVEMTETGITNVSIGQFLSGFTTNQLAGAVASVTESTYVSPTNNPFALTDLLSTATFTSNGSVNDTASVPVGLTSPYSVTEVYTITATNTLADCASQTTDGSSCGTANNTIDLAATTPIPEPASLVLLGSGLVALGIKRRRRKTA